MTDQDRIDFFNKVDGQKIQKRGWPIFEYFIPYGLASGNTELWGKNQDGKTCYELVGTGFAEWNLLSSKTIDITSASYGGSINIANIPMQQPLLPGFQGVWIIEDGCQHEMKEYTGFTETYSYCTKCDHKVFPDGK